MTYKVILEKNEELKKRKEQVANRLSGLKKEYERKDHGDSLKILGSLIDSLAIVTAAEIIQKRSSPLFLSMKIALQGIEGEKAGMLGRVLSLVIKGIENVVVENCLEKEEVKNKNYFTYLIQIFVLGTIGVAQYFKKLNLGKVTDSKDDKEKKIFESELIFLMILKTEIIDLILKEAVDACAIRSQHQPIIVNLVKALVLILSLLTISGGDQQILKALSLNLKDYLKISLNDIQNFINLSDQQNLEKSFISIFTQDALVSLNEEDFESLFQAYTKALENLNVKPKDVEFEIEKIKNGAEIIFNAFMEGDLAVHRTTTSLMI